MGFEESKSIFEFVMFIFSIFPFLIFFLMFYLMYKATKKGEAIKANGVSIESKKIEGIIRAGSHHKGRVGSTKKDAEWEETRSEQYKEEIFGKDTCNRYTPPDYDSLTCEDEDLSGR